MPGWLIEWFASDTLNQLFWIITLAASPFWLMMIIAPGKRFTRDLCSPLIGPVILSCGVAYLWYLLWELGPPAPPAGIEYSHSASVVDHPIVLLILWLHVQTLNLFLGESIYADARRRKMWIGLELILCWAAGPIGLLVYAARLVITMPIRKR